ncbi:MAG: hypothetical protein Q8N31_20430 [Reyranella sp.]|nr:hypothetical protein [Reyranella sp.]MDP3162385.1 hypothetical protein [Reyranella sp.]
MRYAKKIAAALAGIVAVPTIACAATIGGVYYAPQYDYTDFWAASDNKTFQVVIEGNPFPGMAADEMAQRLLPVMQIAKPRPNLTFTYDKPAEMPRPHYRLVLVFDYPNDLRADAVCEGKMRTAPPAPGVFKLFAIYCRNDMAMSQTTAWTPATGPDDPRVQQLFRELFMVVFTDSMAQRPQNGLDRR